MFLGTYKFGYSFYILFYTILHVIFFFLTDLIPQRDNILCCLYCSQIGDPYATGPSTSLTCQLSSASDLCQNIQTLSQSTDIQGNLQELVHSIEKVCYQCGAGLVWGGGWMGVSLVDERVGLMSGFSKGV